MTQPQHIDNLNAFNNPHHQNHAAIVEACIDEMNRLEKTISNDDLRRMIASGQITVGA